MNCVTGLSRARRPRGAWFAATVVTAIIVAGCSKPKQADEESPPTKTVAGMPAEEFLAWHNRGVALMGKFDFDRATEVFEKLAAEPRADDEIRVDLAIATLNRQRSDDAATALAMLEAVLKSDPRHVRARYCAALLMIYARRVDEAIAHLRQVTQADPRDAYAACWLGQCLLAKGDAAAAEQEYRRAIAAEPYLRSGYFGAFQSLQRQGKGESGKPLLADFERLKDNPQARLADLKYKRMGVKAEVAPRAAPAKSGPAAEPPAGDLFAPPVELPLAAPLAPPWTWRRSPDAVANDRPVQPSLTACDINGDGRIDLFAAAAIARDGRASNAVLLAEGEQFRVAVDHPLTNIGDVRAALWGDIDNDGLVDVYLCRRGPNQLWRQSPAGTWNDVTSAAKADGGAADTADGLMFDADHDGDLDLLLVNADGPNELLSNNLDGTFRPLGQSQGIAGDGRPSRQALAVDIDSDRDLDLIILREQPPHDVFLNDRLWNYRPAAGWDEFRAAPVSAVISGGAKSTGQLTLISVADGENVSWVATHQGASKAMVVAASTPPAKSAIGPGQIAVADFTGTAQPSLLVHRADGGAVLPLGSPTSRSAQLAGLADCWTPCVFDPARGPAVVDLPAGQAPRIWRPGPGRWPFVALSFSGREKKADQMRSNASGIGARVAVRVGPFDATWDVLRASTSPGQSLQPLAIGARDAKAIDFVAVTWSDGVYQTEMELPAGHPHRIEETQRQTSSCPVLFAWNGTEYAFVTDLLGVGGIGFNLGRGEFAPPRPWENVLLPADLLRASHGRYALKLAEPMEEICYLDAARLIAYDLPPGWRMTLDERFAEEPPHPTGAPVFYRNSVPLVWAHDGRGRDVTAELKSADFRAVEPGAADRRFLGLTAPHEVTLEFAAPLESGVGRPTLILNGWVEYPYSQTSFAAWQASARYQSVSLEARGADGSWRMVHERFGYPAGMPREMSLPIEKNRLPAGSTHLRLRTNMEVYWDSALLVQGELCPDALRRELPLLAARLSPTGFARRATFAQRRPHYDYELRSADGDLRHPPGRYTRFGAVEPLVASVDDAVAVFGPGEETHLEFGAAEPPLPSGWSRRHVLESHGWCKDFDLYTGQGETVEPLPRRDTSAPVGSQADRLHRDFNTRAVPSGPPGARRSAE